MIVHRVTRSRITYAVTLDPKNKIAKYFTLSELANNSGDPTKAQYIDSPLSEILRCILDDYRAWRCKPVTISCCHRQPAWNAKVGGLPDSLHLLSQAADVQFPRMTDQQWDHIRDFMLGRFAYYGVIGELIRYPWGFHVGVGVTYQKTNYIGDKR